MHSGHQIVKLMALKRQTVAGARNRIELKHLCQGLKKKDTPSLCAYRVFEAARLKGEHGRAAAEELLLHDA